MKLTLLSLVLVALATSKPMIPDLYNLNKGVLTSDYSVTYNSPVSGEFGFTSEAGDINNDGIADFTISNPSFDNNKGIVYVVYGKRGSLRQFNSMNDFEPSDGFIIKGNVAGQKLGFSVSHAGDVNGDGIDDIIIGSPFWNQETGVSYVLFGRRVSSEFPSIVDVDRLSATQGFKIFGEGVMNRAGYSVSRAGDVNGDGISDIILGAFGANGGSGKAYVIFGSRRPLGDMKFPPAQGKGFTIEGSNQENFGASVSKVGDFNGDGVDDIIIGAHCADQWTGKAYIIYGRKAGFPAVIKATEGMTIKGSSTYNNFGCTVSGAGDFNGDGLQDVIIGAYGANNGNGAAYVILGSRQNPSLVNAQNLDVSRGFRVNAWSSSQLGLFVSGGRDLNGDGLSDIVVAAPAFNKDKGAVYVIYGSRQSSFANIIDSELKPSQGFALYGAKEGDRFGSFVKALKDVNKDGVNDLIVGSLGANGKKGAAYLFYIALTCSLACESCSKSNTCDVCKAGFGLLNGNCVICPATHLLKNGICQVKCSQNCASCSKPNSCDLCSPGFGFLNNSCISCPSSTHFLNNGICQERRPKNCIQWSGPNSCDICAAGFGLLGTECVMCPSETHFLSSGTCKVKCPENCQQCTQPNLCDACIKGFGLLDNVCVTCPEKSHFFHNGFCIENEEAWKQIKNLFVGLFH